MRTELDDTHNRAHTEPSTHRTEHTQNRAHTEPSLTPPVDFAGPATDHLRAWNSRPVTREFVEAKGLEPSNLLTASALTVMPASAGR
jgi:hypothetical protein